MDQFLVISDLFQGQDVEYHSEEARQVVVREEVKKAIDEFQLNVNNGATVVDVTPLTVLNLDYAVGKWIHQDCCGNGVAAVAELHYQTSLSNDEIAVSGLGDTLLIDSMDVLNLTLGAQIHRGCWTVTPAYVTPISSNELFDWEAVLHVNRRF